MKTDGSGKYMTVQDFIIGSEIRVFGKNIYLTGIDQYTREFYEGIGIRQPDDMNAPSDTFEQKTVNKFVPQKDTMMKDYMEHKLGGGRVPSQKQFLENDRKVINTS